MEQAPKKFIIYWTSRFGGESKGFYTPKFKANMKSFNSFIEAVAFHDKLVKCCQDGEKFGTRFVHHVARFSEEI